jgi:hypothetical protein
MRHFEGLCLALCPTRHIDDGIIKSAITVTAGLPELLPGLTHGRYDYEFASNGMSNLFMIFTLLEGGTMSKPRIKLTKFYLFL